MSAPSSIPSPAAAPVPAKIERALVWTALIGAVFCVVLAAVMISLHLRSKATDPLKAPQLTALKERLAASPKDESLKQQIRQMDFEVRRRYFREVGMNAVGGWLLLAGFVGFLLAARKVYQWREQPPMPQAVGDTTAVGARVASQARWSAAATSALLAVLFVVLGLKWIPAVPSRPGEVEALLAGPGGSAASLPGPSAADYEKNWPRFRGPGGNGVSMHTNVLLQWNVEAGTGVLWKTPVPVAGFNSPVVWGDRVFLSGGDKQQREVMCFDLASGKLLWQRAVTNVPNSPSPLPEISEQTGFAAPTMATDGQRAYVMFANGDVAAFQFDGTLAWAKSLGLPKNQHGHASSITTWQDRLIIQLDQGSIEDRASRLYALEGATGKIVWQSQRPVGSSWASPIVIDAAGKAQVIAIGPPWIIAHNAADGLELWRAEGLENEVTPSPIFANSRLFVVNPNTFLMALRCDGQGDVTKTHIQWKAEDGIPDITSPVSNGELVFVASTGGMLTGYDAADGKKLWEHDFGTDINASPSLVGQRLVVFTVEGTGLILAAGRTFQELGKSALGEKVFASPAFVADRMLVRGAQHLFCIGAAPGKVAAAE